MHKKKIDLFEPLLALTAVVKNLVKYCKFREEDKECARKS